MTKLSHEKIDQRVSLYKGVAGAIPIAGPFISEIISTIIPGQRLDRISEFLKFLDERISRLEQESLKDNKYFVDLFEDSLIQASRAISMERNLLLSLFLSKSANVNRNNYTAKKKLFRILEDLTDDDIKVLAEISGQGHWMIYREIEPPVISVVEYEAFSEEERYEWDLKSSLWESHVSTLERLNLIVPERKLPESVSVVGSINYDPSNISELDNLHIDKDTGLPEISGYKQTKLGRALLSSISREDT